MRLETGKLSLEDSLQAFEEGIGLVRRGEALLGEAEKRIEQLLEAGGELKAVPLELPPTGPQGGSPAARPAQRTPAPHAPTPPPPEDDDVPF
ncbi:MAG: exodeoxyribonuclease VII small subunit [Myxococcaceae bacterium]|nr:exodeoxyribonuclease VII small subunit [Myxococcaceae bacterium]